jgi:hypothetical protein
MRSGCIILSLNPTYKPGGMLSEIRKEKKMSKWVKVIFFAVLLIGAGYYFGTICMQIDQVYKLILAPSKELLVQILWLLLSLSLVLVCAGLVAALIRPVWVGFITFALSGLAVLFGWHISAITGILAFLYVLAGIAYSRSVDGQLNQQIKFSVRPISQSQGILLTVLILVACGSLYLGYAEHIEREGFSIPESYVEILMELMEKQIVAGVPIGGGEVVIQFREEFQKMIDGFIEGTVEPYERFIPLAMALGLFMPLVTITGLLTWVPALFLKVLFTLLTALGVAKTVTETREVQRLIID